MTYKLVCLPRARRQLAALAPLESRKIIAAMQALVDNPRPPGSLKLKGGPNCLFRVGNYRVVYEIDDKIVTVMIVKIGHRKDVYR